MHAIEGENELAVTRLNHQAAKGYSLIDHLYGIRRPTLCVSWVSIIVGSYPLAIYSQTCCERERQAGKASVVLKSLCQAFAIGEKNCIWCADWWCRHYNSRLMGTIVMSRGITGCYTLCNPTQSIDVVLVVCCLFWTWTIFSGLTEIFIKISLTYLFIYFIVQITCE